MGESTPPTEPVPSTPAKASVAEKSPRPILKKKRTGPRISSLLGTPRSVEQEVVQESKVEMAASFLQFCAMCERQIMTPCNSILYCSEACRSKDSMKPLSAAIINTSAISPPPSEPPSPRAILSPRLPTGVRFSREPSLASIATPDLHDHSSDLDPTEWKPIIAGCSHSDAARYLSRFQHRGSIRSVADEHTAMVAATKTAEDVSTGPPSLGTTPTTTAASSLSTSAGLAHAYTHPYYIGHSCSTSQGWSHYDLSNRPLPTRQSRWYGSYGSSTPRGIDLVTPHVVPPVHGPVTTHGGTCAATAIAPDHEGLKWEKKRVMFATPSRGDDGLSILFAEHGK